jgi:hypothetical protein
MLLDIHTNKMVALDKKIGALSPQDFMLWLVLNHIHYYERPQESFSEQEAITETAKKGLSTVYITKSKLN